MIWRRALPTLLAVAALAASVAAVPAGADLQLGGSVPSLVALAIGSPTTFKHNAGDVYTLRIPVDVTSTVTDAQLSIADGEDLAGPARGRLRDGSRVVPVPLQAEVAGRPPQLLSAPTDPVLDSFGVPVSLAPLTITLRATLGAATAASHRLHKMVWITVSGPTP